MAYIAVTGASGQLGRLLIAQLKQRLAHDAIIALVRDPAKAAALGGGALQDWPTMPSQTL